MYVPRFYYKIYYTVNWPNCRLIFLFALNQSIAGFQLGWPLNGLHPPHAKFCEEKNVFAGELQVSLASFVQNYGFFINLRSSMFYDTCPKRGEFRIHASSCQCIGWNIIRTKFFFCCCSESVLTGAFVYLTFLTYSNCTLLHSPTLNCTQLHSTSTDSTALFFFSF